MRLSLNTTIAIIALIAAAIAAFYAWQSESKVKIQELESRISEMRQALEDHSHEKIEAAFTECRICFKETEGSSQCQGRRESCSAWSGRNDVDGDVVGNWTTPFRDDTDNRPGGCKYQWMVQCR